MPWAGAVSDRVQQRRLLFALVASALLHAAVMQAVEGTAAGRAQRAAPMPLIVTLPHVVLSEQVDARPLIEAPVQAPALQSPVNDFVLDPQQRSSTSEHAPLPIMQKPAHSYAALSTPGDAVVTQMSDPTYYGARSLDVYPKALSALDLGLVSAGGKVRATVYIDEAGLVNDVRAIQAATPDAEHAARDVLMRTRFTPAYKDGRVVKAQVVVSLE